jgi:hypothetical protein
MKKGKYKIKKGNIERLNEFAKRYEAELASVSWSQGPISDDPPGLEHTGDVL